MDVNNNPEFEEQSSAAEPTVEKDGLRPLRGYALPYYTPNLELTQYTPNSKTSYLTNYNEDMRKIDRFSTSIGALIEENVEDTDRMIREVQENVTQVLHRVEDNEADINDLYDWKGKLTTSLAAFKVEVQEDITESENRSKEALAEAMAGTASVIATMQDEIKEQYATTTASIIGLEQRMGVAEDEIVILKNKKDEQDAAIAEAKNIADEAKRTADAADAKVTAMDTRVTDAEGEIAANQADIASLQATETVQNSTLENLTETVASLETLGEDVNKLKNNNISNFIIPQMIGGTKSVSTNLSSYEIPINIETIYDEEHRYLTMDRNIILNITAMGTRDTYHVKITINVPTANLGPTDYIFIPPALNLRVNINVPLTVDLTFGIDISTAGGGASIMNNQGYIIGARAQGTFNGHTIECYSYNNNTLIIPNHGAIINI